MLSARTRFYIEYTRFLRRYHRFSVDGLDRLLVPGSKLVVGYHGRGFPMDLGILGLEIFERKGYLPRSIIHAGLWAIPGVHWVIDQWGAIPGDVPAVAEAVERGEVLFVAPGGTREGLRSFRERYVVDWGARRGYLKLALKHGLPILPVASSGVDDRFFGLNDGHAWGKRLGMPADIPFWLALGLGGVFPFALPLPSRIHTIIGEPIDLKSASSLSPDDPAHIEDLHRIITARIQDLLDEALERSDSTAS